MAYLEAARSNRGPWQTGVPNDSFLSLGLVRSGSFPLSPNHTVWMVQLGMARPAASAQNCENRRAYTRGAPFIENAGKMTALKTLLYCQPQRLRPGEANALFAGSTYSLTASGTFDLWNANIPFGRVTGQ